jgi:hypothetical protein
LGFAHGSLFIISLPFFMRGSYFKPQVYYSTKSDECQSFRATTNDYISRLHFPVNATYPHPPSALYFAFIFVGANLYGCPHFEGQPLRPPLQCKYKFKSGFDILMAV